MRKSIALAMMCLPLAAFLACGGGEQNTTTSAPLPSAQSTGTATAATTAPSTNATPTATAAPAATIPPEYTAARAKLDAMMQKVIDTLSAVKAPASAATCDKLAADLNKIAKDPDNKKIAQSYAAEFGKLDADQRKAVADANKAQPSVPPPPQGPNGKPVCSDNKKAVDAVGAIGDLVAAAMTPPK